MKDPFKFFDEWYAEAEKAGVIEPNAMVLSTVDERHRPSARVVLLKKIHEGGFYFFTNYSSRKAKCLDMNPVASLTFHWRQPHGRQVRIEGDVRRASSQISDEYFSSRPRGSQIGAWASPQSQQITDRSELEKRVTLFEKQFENKSIPRPEFWGGYGIFPTLIEFWQEGEFRLHLRQQYIKTAAGWELKTLAP